MTFSIQTSFKWGAMLGSALAAIATSAHADWTGPYIGIGAGYGISRDDVSFAPGPALGGLIAGNLSIDGFANTGGFFSLSAGYDYQVNRSLVVGAFIDYDISNMSLDTSISVPGLFNASAGSEIENQLFLGGRVGYLASPSTLFFVSAGYARVETSDVTFAADAGGIGVTGVLAAIPTLEGYFIGGGAETKIGHGFSIKAEYRYTDLSEENFELLPGLGLAPFLTSTIDTTIQTGRISLNYRFGEGGASSADSSDAAIARSWTGAYGAISAGYGAASSELSLSNTPLVAPFNATVDGAGSKGGVFGIGVGYDYQVNRSIVVGALAEWQLARLQNEISANFAAGGVTLGGQIETEVEDVFYLGGRVGYLASPDTLVFVSAGYANAQLDDTTFSGSLDLGGGPLTATATLIGGERFSGLFLGGGIETRLTGSLSLKAEYRYVDFGSEQVTLLPDIAPAINALVSTEVDPTLHLGMVSLVYRFGAEERATPLK